jgi:hypothetical protein
MTRHSIVIVAALLTMGTIPLAQERQVGGVGLTMFADSNFRGEVLTFRNDVPNLATVNLFKLASSLRVADGELWEVCDQPDYGGACLVVSGSENDLGRRGWNDRIASARRVRGGPGGGRRGGGGDGVPGNQTGLELYAEARFYGERQVFRSAVSNLYQLGFNDRAMSLSIPQGDVWEVCVEANFRDCRSFSASVMDLTELGLARNISSVRPIRQGRGGGIFSGGSSGARLMLFDNQSFSGESRMIDRDTPAISGFANRAESLQVMGGTWDICDGPNFSGRCITVTGNMQDLSPIGFSNRIQSVRLQSR